MQVTNYAFEHLPFSKLFKTYINDYRQLSDFYAANPFDEDAVAEKINNFQFAGDRQQSVEILASFNEDFDVHQAALDNLERLRDDEALAIVTGQQLGVYGGPLYTIFKTVSTIHVAKQLEQKYDRPVIPIFWLADEDHDYDEIRGLNVLENDEVAHFELPPKETPHHTVAEMSIPEEITEMRTELRESLYNTDFSDTLWELLDTAFKPDTTFFEGFGQFISKLFSSHGLVLAGSNQPDVKQLTGDFLKRSIASADKVRQSLEKQTSLLSENYHQQVTLYDSNLFYLDEKTGRTKISRNSNGWHVTKNEQWNTEQLIAEIDKRPEKFSPNVFMRPILQDALLPTLGYVAGPGETAYFGQMKGLYSCFNLEMPIIFPRLSATLIEPAIDRIFHELPFEFHEYGNRIEDLESSYVEQTEQHDLEAIFEGWKQDIEKLAEPRKDTISDIDPTLEGAVEKTTSRYFGELDKLKGKVYRSVKKQDEIQLKRIRRIKANLFPGDGLQERTIAALFFMNKYGVDIWDKLLDTLEPEEQFDQHKLVYL